MKKIINSTLFVAGLFAVTSCSDFLETSSPSVVDANFVFSNIETARAAMDGAYETWRDCAQNAIFGDGVFYAADVTGSDIERHPEPFTNQPGRHYPENLYQNGKFAGSYGLLSYLTETSAYAKLYSTIGKANAVINAMQSAANFQSIISAGSPSELSQLYGEAVALRATAYRELIRNFGDVPYQTKSGVAASGLSSRDSIYDACLEDLKLIEPLMYRVGEGGVAKNFFSRTFVQGLIGRMAMDASGYQTRRTDLGASFYKDGKGNLLTLETLGTPNNECVYARRSDWKTLQAVAKTYLKACIENAGIAKFHATDPRAVGKNGQLFENPYQYFFQQMNNLEFADESIYEYAMTQGIGNDARPYSMGRVSSGGGSNNYPCKSYGQARINPAYYYGMFDPKDKRRDVSVCVTGSTGSNGTEKLIPFTMGSTANAGGLTLNKWDECRMATPYVAKQRLSGINGPYMRLADIYLLYAEACAATGDEANAKTYLKLIRERSFPAGQAKTDEFITSCGSLFKAIVTERAYEFAGEGDRRWALVRTGLLPESIRAIKEMTKAMLDGLSANGYYTFANGNTISGYVWTKLIDAKTDYGYRLTTQCPVGKENDPVLSPGWRGQHDDWGSLGLNYGTATPKTNLGIKGLFKTELPSKLVVTYTKKDPAGEKVTEEITTGISIAKITDLLNNYNKDTYTAVSIADADGYTANNWGVDLVKLYDEYYTYLFYDYDYSKAPIYLWPFTPNTISTGGFTNGYGFKQQ